VQLLIFASICKGDLCFQFSVNLLAIFVVFVQASIPALVQDADSPQLGSSTSASNPIVTPVRPDNPLGNSIHPFSSEHSLRTFLSEHPVSNNDLIIQQTKLKFSQRAFSVAGLRIWNQLPTELKTTENTAAFKRKLKTYFFSVAYSQ